MIRVLGLRKSFGEFRAVEDVSFEANDGSVTGIVGPNGAGKTTTIRMICAMVRPDAGTASVDGCDVTKDVNEVRRRIGVLPDTRGLYPRLTSREHVRYFGRLHGLRGAALERNIDELVELLDMKEIDHRRVDGFSEGQRVKVAIARALVHRPANVILDEPTNGLDVSATRALRTMIGQLKDAGRCVVFSSHVMQEVTALCDHVVVIGRGKVLLRGTPDGILEATGKTTLEDAFVSVTAADSVEGGAL